MLCEFAFCFAMVVAVDGDTFKAPVDGMAVRYRIWGIQAPEYDEPGGVEATQALWEITGGRNLYCDLMDIDRYDRPVVQCFLDDGTDIAQLLVDGGYAEDWPRYSRGYYAED